MIFLKKISIFEVEIQPQNHRIAKTYHFRVPPGGGTQKIA